jgi:hypothetical protein
MKVLIVPMAALAETAGSFSRCALMAEVFHKAGIEVATCIARDLNYREIKEIKNYYLDIPMPFGMPGFIATKTFPLAQRLGITARKTVSSFDQVLQFTGNLDYRYLKKSVQSISRAIEDFEPDVVYSEFNISAMIAAKLARKRLFITVSFPTQHAYANRPELARGLNRLLGELGLDRVESALQIFDLADECFCPSIRELEPIEKEKVTFCGAWKKVCTEENVRNKILVYMGNGTISAPKMERVIRDAFRDSAYEVYIASGYLTERTEENLHIAARWDFDRLLREAVLFINHGGQNSVIDGVLYEVPQIIVPGKVFERRYNAQAIVRNHAGVMIDNGDFQAVRLRQEMEKVVRAEEIKENIKNLAGKLQQQGGLETIIGHLQNIAGGNMRGDNG